MGFFDFGLNDERKPARTTVRGYAGRPCESSDTAIRSRLAGIGQTTDSATGTTGRTAEEAYDNYKATGATAEQLDAFVRRIIGE